MPSQPNQAVSDGLANVHVHVFNAHGGLAALTSGMQRFLLAGQIPSVVGQLRTRLVQAALACAVILDRNARLTRALCAGTAPPDFGERVRQCAEACLADAELRLEEEEPVGREVRESASEARESARAQGFREVVQFKITLSFMTGPTRCERIVDWQSFAYGK